MLKLHEPRGVELYWYRWLRQVAVLCCDTSGGQQGGNWVVMSSAPPLQTRHSHNNKHRAATGETFHTVTTVVHTDIVSMSSRSTEGDHDIFSAPNIFPSHKVYYPDTSLHHIEKVCSTWPHVLLWAWQKSTVKQAAAISGLSKVVISVCKQCV